MATITAKKAGKATISIKSKYSDDYVLKTDFYVNMIDSSHSRLSLKRSTYNYDGTEHKPSATLTINGVAATEGTDFKLSYEGDLVNAGTATVTATGIGKYTGSVSTTYRINPQTLTAADTSISVESAYYNGSEQKPAVSVTHNGKKLTPDTDYTVAYTNNIEVTDYARARITGQGNYTGSMTRTFTITNARIPAVITAKSVTLNQSTKKTSVFTAETDGKITLKSSNSKIVKVSGTKIIPVAPGKVTLTITAARGQDYEKASKKISVTVRPLTTSKLSLKSTAKKQATVSWTARKSISRYQIYYSRRSDMKNAKHITAKSSAKSAVLKNLTSKKKYYVRIRTYKTVSGKKYYSTWSSVKSVTVK